MAERWLTLLFTLTQRLLEQGELLDDPTVLLEELTAEGYQPKEVEAGLAWIGRFVAERGQGTVWYNETFTSRGFRTRSAEEHLSFSPEAFGFLLRLENSGLIDPLLREEILERALGTYEDEIGEEEIRFISRMVLQDYSHPGTDADADPLELIAESRLRHLH